MQQGKYAAQSIQTLLSGGTPQPFAYHDKGSMATIGRARAVVSAGPLNFAVTVQVPSRKLALQAVWRAASATHNTVER